MQAAFSTSAENNKAFAKAAKKIRPPNWDRTGLEEFRARQTKKRRTEDLQKLSHIFSLAAKIPELHDALEWARDHGIEFIVDHKARAGGYYTVGTGVVAVVNKSFENEGFAAGVVVHEIRHAWQDYYGLIATKAACFTDYYIREGLIEADATAHEARVARQYGIAQDIERVEKAATQNPAYSPSVKVYRKMMEDTRTDDASLWSNFAAWYGDRSYYYGKSTMKFFGRNLGVPGVTCGNLQAEFQPYKGREVPKTEGIGIMSFDQLRRLGRGFKGGNYFDKAWREALYQQVLAPGRAATLYHSVGERPPRRYTRVPLVEEIRRRELRLKLHKIRSAGA